MTNVIYLVKFNNLIFRINQNMHWCETNNPLPPHLRPCLEHSAIIILLELDKWIVGLTIFAKICNSNYRDDNPNKKIHNLLKYSLIYGPKIRLHSKFKLLIRIANFLWVLLHLSGYFIICAIRNSRINQLFLLRISVRIQIRPKNLADCHPYLIWAFNLNMNKFVL